MFTQKKKQLDNKKNKLPSRQETRSNHVHKVEQPKLPTLPSIQAPFKQGGTRSFHGHMEEKAVTIHAKIKSCFPTH